MGYRLKIGPPQGLKLKGNAGFALPLLGGDAISTIKAGGLWRVDLDYSEVQTGSTVNDDTAYMLTWDSASGAFTRLNVTDLKVEFQGTFDGYYQPLDATLTALAALDSTAGLLVQTGEDTFERRTLTGTANEITVTSGGGVSGNPTLSLPSALTFTGKTVTGGTFNSPAISTPTGLVKGDVGLGNVDNTSDATKNAASATLTNKTIDTAGPNTIKINGNTLAASAGTATVTIPNATDTLVARGTTDTLTNKTISGASNTLSNIGNSSLTNSSMTIAGHSVSLGGSQAIAVGDLSPIADGTIASNVSGGSAAPAANSISSVLDKLFGTAQGTIAYRGASGWSALTPGTSGNFLKTQGASANPVWASIPGGGDMLAANNLGDVADADMARTNISAAKSGANSDITSLSALTNATLQASPANPTLTTSSTAVMMGLGGTCKLTPGASGRIRLTFQGTINPALSGVIGNVQVKYGTGTAPSNGAAATGTSLGSNVQTAISAANTYFPFSVGGIITGLTPGTAYWFDLSIFVTGGGNLSVFNISCSAMEF